MEEKKTRKWSVSLSLSLTFVVVLEAEFPYFLRDLICRGWCRGLASVHLGGQLLCVCTIVMCVAATMIVSVVVRVLLQWSWYS